MGLTLFEAKCDVIYNFVYQEIGILRGLISLDISKNRLEWLPPEIESLHSLSELYLTSNFLLELPENIGECLSDNIW